MNNNKNFSLIYFILGILLYGSGFSNIFRLCKNSTWLVVIIGTILSTIILLLYKNLKKNKYIKLLNILIILLINMMILRIFTTSFYLTKTPGILITLPFILLCLYNSSKGISVINKEANILIIFSIITISLNMLGASKTGHIYFFTPIINSSYLNLIKAVIYYVSYILSPLVLLDNINIENKEYIKGFIFTNIFILFITVMIIYVLGPNLIQIYRFPEYMIYKEIHLFGFIENVENLVGLIYFLNLFITSSLCLYNIKDVVKNNYIFYLLMILVLFITEIVSDKYKYSLLIYKYLPYVLLTIIILYTILNVLKKQSHK